MNAAPRTSYAEDEKMMLEMTKIKLLEDRKKDLEKGVILLNQEFDRFSMESVLRDLDALATNKNIDIIKLRIHSYGGHAFSLVPLIEWIERSAKPVATEVIGHAYSCGAMLLLSGTPGHRYAGRYSDILLHEVAQQFPYGKSSQQTHYAERLARLNKLLIDFLKRKTKMTDKDIAYYMESNTDIFINAKQALKYGIIDHIL